MSQPRVERRRSEERSVSAAPPAVPRVNPVDAVPDTNVILSRRAIDTVRAACNRSRMRTLLVFLVGVLLMSDARTADAPGPDAAMLGLAHRVARFIATLDDAEIAGVFADRDVV